MRAETFETITRKHGFRPMVPRTTVHGRILLADRWFGFADMDKSPGAKDGNFRVLAPHWCTMWVLDRGGLDGGQYVYHADRHISREKRIADAIRAAGEWVKHSIRRFA